MPAPVLKLSKRQQIQEDLIEMLKKAKDSWYDLPNYIENKKSGQILKRKKFEGSDLEQIMLE